MAVQYSLFHLHLFEYEAICSYHVIGGKRSLQKLMYNVTQCFITYAAPHIPQTRCMQFVVCPVQQILPLLISKNFNPEKHVPSCYLFFLITNSFILQQSPTHTHRSRSKQEMKKKVITRCAKKKKTLKNLQTKITNENCQLQRIERINKLFKKYYYIFILKID